VTCPRCDTPWPHQHVTNGLVAAGLVDTSWFTDEARVRGTYVHKAAELLDRNNLDESSLDPVIAPYIDAYRAFLRDARPEWDYIEHRVEDRTMGYVGRLDRAGTAGRLGRFVLDIKSGAVFPVTGLQLAAYRRCLPKPTAWKRYALQLSDDGTYRIHEFTDRTDERVFLAALAVAQWKDTHQ